MISFKTRFMEQTF